MFAAEGETHAAGGLEGLVSGSSSWQGNYPAKLQAEPCRRGKDASAPGRAGEMAQAPAFKAFSLKDTHKKKGGGGSVMVIILKQTLRS